MAELHQIFAHVACDRGSVLLWWLCDTLFTSGFVDNVIFSYRGPWGQWARIKHDDMFRRSSPDGGTSWTSRQLQRPVEFIVMRHRGWSLAIYDWLMLCYVAVFLLLYSVDAFLLGDFATTVHDFNAVYNWSEYIFSSLSVVKLFKLFVFFTYLLYVPVLGE